MGKSRSEAKLNSPYKEDWELNRVKSYVGIHRWIKYHYGKANKCENPNCNIPKIKRFEWALRPGYKYEKKRENFMQLCSSCHRQMDLTPEARERLTLIKGIPIKLTTPQGEVIKYRSITEAAKQFNVAHTTIIFALKGITKKPRFGKWEYQTLTPKVK